MMNKPLLLLIAVMTWAGLSRADSPPQALSLSDVILCAEQFSPNLKAAQEGEHVAEQSLRISQSLYYPTLDITAADSTGFPASANAPTGFNGLMSSPYRVGLTGGAYTTFTFFDLTREYGVKASHYGLEASREDTKVQRLNVDLKAMNLYMDAALSLAQRETWKGIQNEVDRLYGVVQKYVRNGQYSEVTTWLLKNQTEQALQKQEDYDLAYQAALRRIEIEIGAPANSLTIQGLPSLQPTFDEIQKHHLAESPLITRPEAQTKASQAVVLTQSAQNWPRLMGIASAGGMDDSRLVPMQNYSAWIGLTFPIFEGFRISADEQRAQAEAEKKQDQTRQAQMELQESDTRYNQETLTHQSDIKHLQVEREDALKALKLAEHRYTTFVGDLADVRDSLYSWESSESDLNAAQVELFRSMLSRAMIDGGYLAQTIRQDLN
jgi:outer membrane protein TolC